MCSGAIAETICGGVRLKNEKKIAKSLPRNIRVKGNEMKKLCSSSISSRLTAIVRNLYVCAILCLMIRIGLPKWSCRCRRLLNFVLSHAMRKHRNSPVEKFNSVGVERIQSLWKCSKIEFESILCRKSAIVHVKIILKQKKTQCLNYMNKKNFMCLSI